MRQAFIYIILYTVALSSFTGCSIEDDTSLNVEYEIVPIVSAILPSQFRQGEEDQIEISYELPNSCYEFDGFEIESSENEHTIYSVAFKLAGTDCGTEEGRLFEVNTLNFTASNSGVYVFKFYSGTNEIDEAQFIEYRVPVIP